MTAQGIFTASPGRGSHASLRCTIPHQQVAPFTQYVSLRVASSMNGIKYAEGIRLLSTGKTRAGQQCAFAEVFFYSEAGQ